jgi:hypothetical protein
MKFRLALYLVFGVASVPAFADYAADITYDYKDLGGGKYRFDVTVNNTSTGADTGALDYFQINFDADSDWATYAGVAWTKKNGWVTTDNQFDPAFGSIPAALTADHSVLVIPTDGGIAQGKSSSGFAFEFTYSGSLGPKQQALSFLADFGTAFVPGSAEDYTVLGEVTGNLRYVPTGPGPDPGQIPEPATILLVGMGLCGWIGLRKRSR